jgi:hypothetical protein
VDQPSVDSRLKSLICLSEEPESTMGKSRSMDAMLRR